MIHTTGKLFLTILFSLFFAISSSIAQGPSISLVSDTSELVHGQNFTIDLVVSDFTDMLGVQFSLNWDANVLEFQSVDNFGIADMTLANNFGLVNVEEGALSFLWYDVNLAGVSLADGAVLFSLNFTVLGAENDTAALTFSNTPTVIEFSVTSSSTPVEAALGNFERLIGTVATSFNSAPELIEIKELFPNPFVTNSQLDFKLAHSTDLSFFIFDENGKMVLHTRKYFTSGNHSFNIESGDFPSSGNYLLRLVSEDFEVQQKLVFIGK